MVDLPTVPDRITTSTAPTSSVSRSDIIGDADRMAGAMSKVADATMDIATRQAKEQAANDLQDQKVTLNADGTVSVLNPANSMIFGAAGDAYHTAVQAGTLAQHSNVISQEMNELHQKYPTDPQAFQTAADAWKSKYLEDHGGGQVGQAISQQADQLQTQHGNAITNTTAQIDLKTQSGSLAALQTRAQDDAMAMLRGGANINDPALQGKMEQFESAARARQANPLMGYSKEQMELDIDNFHGEAAANRKMYDVKQIYNDQGTKTDPTTGKQVPAGGYANAMASAQDVLTNPGYQLGQAAREQIYHRTVAEIRANEAVRKQDIGEARAAFTELRQAYMLDPRISSNEIEAVADGFRKAGYPAGASQVYAAFIRKPGIDGFGDQPFATQLQQMSAVDGLNAAATAHKFFSGNPEYGPIASAGIVGNLVHESGMNPMAVGDGGTSGGLAQWHNERLAALKAYATSVGKPASDFQTQLEFTDKELHQPENAGTLAKLKAAKTPEEAAAAFLDFERPKGWTPGDASGSLGFQSRQGFARAVFDGRSADTSMGPVGPLWLQANRAHTLSDTADTQWKTIMTDYSKENIPPSANRVNDVINAARMTKNWPLLDQITKDATRMNVAQLGEQDPLPAQEGRLTDMRAAGSRGELNEGASALMKDLQTRHDAISDGLKKNPIATTVANSPNQISNAPPPLDFSSDGNLAAGLQTRAKIAQFATNKWKPPTPVAALDEPEVQQVKAMLATPDPALHGRVLKALSALPPDLFSATLAKLGADDTDSMVTAAAGSMMRTASPIAESILRGQQTIKTAKEYLPKGDGETAAWALGLNDRLPASIFSLGGRTDATGGYAVAQGMVKARYADLSAQLGDASGKLNPERLTKAIDDVTGGILDLNGGKLIAPARGMNQGQFDRTIWGVTNADLGHVGMGDNFNEAQAALNLTPQEQALYQRHLTNLAGTGGVTNANGSRSTLYQAVAEHDGRFYNVPTVWNGKIETEKFTKPGDKVETIDVPNQTAIANIENEGWDKFPSYATAKEADARYEAMHGYMERDTARYNKGNPAGVTTLNGQPVTADYLRNNATLESVGEGRYFVKLGKDPLRPIYAITGANTESPRRFVLDLRNRPMAVAPETQPYVLIRHHRAPLAVNGGLRVLCSPPSGRTSTCNRHLPPTGSPLTACSQTLAAAARQPPIATMSRSTSRAKMQILFFSFSRAE